MIPGLGNAEFARYGVMHRNTYLASPGLLLQDYSTVNREDLYFAGQMTGVEGYVESAASGLIAGWQASLQAKSIPKQNRWLQLPDEHTVIGALGKYISMANAANFQPMNANFGLVSLPSRKFRGKADKIQAIIEESLLQSDKLAVIKNDLVNYRK
jgi:methylenetetrahydrofolate--tRNA-(uracil-5-)-methyltransferase